MGAAAGEGALCYCLRHLQKARELMDKENPINHQFHENHQVQDSLGHISRNSDGAGYLNDAILLVSEALSLQSCFAAFVSHSVLLQCSPNAG